MIYIVFLDFYKCKKNSWLRANYFFSVKLYFSLCHYHSHETVDAE